MVLVGARPLFEPDQYSLFDFGGGRKLEQFAGIRVLRDCPAAEGVSSSRKDWFEDARNDRVSIVQYCRERKQWLSPELIPANWQIKHGSKIFSLKATPFGHVGVFCEQAQNWDWIDRLPISLTGLRALNLFAHTGGTTMVIAQRGASVVHVDAAKPAVQWARKNAEHSGLADTPIRWIVDDTLKFLGREIKRGNRYDMIVADPPAFGHGPRGTGWKFNRDIGRLFEMSKLVLVNKPVAILFTCHSAGFDARDMSCLAQTYLNIDGEGRSESGTLDLISHSQRKLNCGHYFRWHCEP